jgi:DNA helicase II / ATP-dependent DNA helicase PcrA
MNITEKIKQAPMSGGIMVESSAGTGKTYTMIEKVKHEVEVNGVNPNNIMLSTFTVDAANEIKNRLPVSCAGVSVGTIHSLLLEVVKKHGGQSWFIIDGTGQQKIGFEICKEFKLNFDKIQKYFSMIGYLKNVWPDYYQMLEDGTLPGSEDLKFITFAREYWRKQQHYHKIDFDDLLLLSYEIFRDKPDVLNFYQEKWKYLFIDEAQDLSPTQSEIIKLLGKKYKQLFTVFDKKQSIFGFRGCSVSFVEQFKDLFPDAQSFVLPTTYRCSGEVTRHANKIARVIDFSEINTANPNLGSVEIDTSFNTWSDEVDYVSERAIDLFRKSNDTVRIIFRTNAQSLGFQMKMIDADVPYSSNYQNNIFNRKEVKIGLALCQFVLEYDKLNIMAKQEVLKNLKYLVGVGTDSWHNFMWDIKKYKIDPMLDDNKYEKYLDTIQALNKLRLKYIDVKSPSEIISDIAELRVFDEISDNARDNLIGLAEFFSQAKDMDGVRLLIEKISKPRQIAKNEKCIVLSTIHGSKGLEADTVFVTGVSDDLFPLKSGDPDEELRLAYVAFTRARNNLIVTGCSSFGKKTFDKHSFADLLQG